MLFCFFLVIFNFVVFLFFLLFIFDSLLLVLCLFKFYFVLHLAFLNYNILLNFCFSRSGWYEYFSFIFLLHILASSLENFEFLVKQKIISINTRSIRARNFCSAIAVALSVLTPSTRTTTDSRANSQLSMQPHRFGTSLARGR